MIKPSFAKNNSLNTKKITEDLETYFLRLVKRFEIKSTWCEENFFQIETIIKRPLMPHEVIAFKNSKINIFNRENDDLKITY